MDAVISPKPHRILMVFDNPGEQGAVRDALVVVRIKPYKEEPRVSRLYSLEWLFFEKFAKDGVRMACVSHHFPADVRNASRGTGLANS